MRIARERRCSPGFYVPRNFEPLYNVGCVLNAFALVQARYTDATLTLVGAGSQADELRRIVAERRLRNVSFIGPVPPAEISRYYAQADIYVQTPDIDNMPTSVLEAFASGCAVVSTRAGGSRPFSQTASTDSLPRAGITRLSRRK